ncbi:MAG: trypsin-like peptidase domain-containing protein [Alphaproteobacteria bacterium]|nr:trypsin-like peptidase domain-containing protein [Alphaproteobacteria bacterium]
MARVSSKIRSVTVLGAVAIALTASVSGIASAATVSLPSLSGLVDSVRPSVVSVAAKVTSGAKSGTALGSGFVIDAEGYIVTNAHVILTSNDVEVTFSDGTKYKVRVIGRDQATDVALLKVDAPKKFQAVVFADYRRVKVGDWVVAIGNPFGLGGTVTAGIVSARGRDEVGSAAFTDYLQVDAAINHGNSGGPTFDLSGRVVGMNTLGYPTSSGELASGIGFAIPSSTVQRVVQDLRATGTVSRGFLGVQIESLSDESATALGLPNANGALVTDTIDGSPAQKAGIKRGDVILKINGEAVKDNREASRKIAALQVGQSATFTIWRDNKTISVTVTVAKRDQVAELEVPATAGNAAVDEVKLTSLGLGLKTITAEVRTSFALATEAAGVLVTHIDPASEAALKGLREGDRIVAVGTADVGSLTDVNLAIEQARAQKRPSVLLFVETRAGGKVHIPVKLSPN